MQFYTSSYRCYLYTNILTPHKSEKFQVWYFCKFCSNPAPYPIALRFGEIDRKRGDVSITPPKGWCVRSQFDATIENLPTKFLSPLWRWFYIFHQFLETLYKWLQKLKGLEVKCVGPIMNLLHLLSSPSSLPSPWTAPTLLGPSHPDSIVHKMFFLKCMIWRFIC